MQPTFALSDQQLLDTYTSLANIYTQKLLASPLIDGFALSTDRVIARRLKNFSNKKLSEKFVSILPR